MPNFVKVANTSDLKPGSAMAVVVNGLDIALYNVGGKIFATDNTCVHQRPSRRRHPGWRSHKLPLAHVGIQRLHG